MSTGLASDGRALECTLRGVWHGTMRIVGLYSAFAAQFERNSAV